MDQSYFQNLKRFILRKNNWDTETYEFDEVLIEAAEASSFPDRSRPGNRFLNAEQKVPTRQELGSPTGNGSRISALTKSENENDGLVADLSNREIPILRKKGLRMKKRQPFAVGRSNVVTGLAKTLKTHFQRSPLAIVNIKGRAKGTYVEEVITKLKV